MSRRVILSAFAAAWFTNHAKAAGTTISSVIVIPSIHKRLAGNPHYDYADLYALVAAFHPDLVGVEIRAEDLARPETYLRHNYPEEMVYLSRFYEGHVFGFDWLGDDVSGRAIPEDWWTRQSHIKQLERACGSTQGDTSASLTLLNAQVDALSRQQDRIIDTATAASLADGRYDRVTAAYYKAVAKVTAGTPCEEVSKWYARRDQQISANIVAQVRQAPGRRLAIVTGADHHGPVVAALSGLGASIVLVPVPDEKRARSTP